MKKTLLCLQLALLLISTVARADFEPVTLPAPAGPHAVGTMTYFWTDEARTYSYSSFPGDQRTIAVQLWYPAVVDPASTKAPYSALSADYRHVESHSRLLPAFARDIEAAPLVLISPGRGVERYGYTTIAEELASRGYVVASVDMPGIGYVIYPDGRVESPNPDFRPSRELMAGPYEKVDEFFEKPTELGRGDLELALDGIRGLNDADPAGRFVGRIDLTNIGIFGHSLGGRIAGALAEQNEEVRAYISMEGIAPRRARFEGLEIPVAMLCSSGTLPYARDNYQTLINGRRGEVFMIELVDFGHNSVTDFPLATPSQFSYGVDPREGLEASVEIVRAFFDAFLRGRGGFLESLQDREDVVVTRHAPPVTP